MVPAFSYIDEISESVIEVRYIYREKENRLNHRTDVGDVFCHSLALDKEINRAHIHKKRFLSLAFSGHCDASKLQRRRRLLSYRYIDRQGRKKSSRTYSE